MINKILYLIVSLFFISTSYSDSYVKASDTLIWDSENKKYTANGDVEFKNEKFIAYSRQDVALLAKLDDKLKFIDLFFRN